jgi:preprotein translocase subunit SecD
MKRIITLAILSCFSILTLAFAAPVRSLEIRTTPPERSLVSSKDFTHAEVTESAGTILLNLEVTKPAALKLKDYTRKNVGKNLGLIVDGKLLKTPVIRTAIEEGKFQVDLPEKSTAQSIADFVNHQR